MTQRMFVWMVAILAMAAGVRVGQAHWWHQMGRNAGLGWSDGYHSRTGCPPPGVECRSVAPSQGIPPGVPASTCPSCEPMPARIMAQPARAMAKEGVVPSATSASPASQSRTTPSWAIPTPVRP